jgi:uncharacterized protein (DUF58 family)
MKLGSNKTYILPTRYGAVFFPIVLIEFVVSITFGHPFAYFITFSTVSIIILSAFYTNSSFNHISIGFLESDLVESETSSMVQFKVKIGEDFVRKEVSIEGSSNSKVFLQTISKDKDHLSVNLEFPKRGVYYVERLKISSTFPFGLFYAWKYYDINLNFYCYPKIIDIEDTSSIQSFEQSDIQSLSTSGSNNDDFFEHKKALDGDSWKHIDWKAYSRGMGLLSKVYNENQSISHNLKINSSASEDEIQRLSSSLYFLYKKNISSKLIIDDEVISSGEGRGHLDNCLRAVSRINAMEITNV